jgi:hypothetical protein
MNRKMNIQVNFHEYLPKNITIQMNMNFDFSNSSWTVADARFYAWSLSVGYTWAFFKVYANIYLKNLVIPYENDQNLWRPSNGFVRD